MVSWCSGWIVHYHNESAPSHTGSPTLATSSLFCSIQYNLGLCDFLFLALKGVFLAVQDSSISDIV